MCEPQLKEAYGGSVYPSGGKGVCIYVYCEEAIADAAFNNNEHSMQCVDAIYAILGLKKHYKYNNNLEK